MIDKIQVMDGLMRCISLHGYSDIWPCAQCAYVKDKTTEQCQPKLMQDALTLLQLLNEELHEIRGDLEEMSRNHGHATQQDTCKYLIHRMEGLEKRLFDGQEEENEKSLY